MLLGRAREFERAALDLDHLSASLALEAAGEFPHGLRRGFRVGEFFDARHHGCHATCTAAITDGVLDALTVVVGGAALTRHQNAGEDCGGAEHGAGRRLCPRLVFLLHFLADGASVARVGVEHPLVELLVVAIEGVDHRSIALANLADARECRIVLGWQPRHSGQTVSVGLQITAERSWIEILCKSQLCDLAHLAALARAEFVAGRHQIVGDLRVDVLEGVARAHRRVGFVGAEICIPGVTFVFDPDTTHRVAGVDFEFETTTRRFDDLAADQYVGEFHTFGHDTYCTPLPRLFERRFETSGQQT